MSAQTKKTCSRNCATLIPRVAAVSSPIVMAFREEVLLNSQEPQTASMTNG